MSSTQLINSNSDNIVNIKDTKDDSANSNKLKFDMLMSRLTEGDRCNVCKLKYSNLKAKLSDKALKKLEEINNKKNVNNPIMKYIKPGHEKCFAKLFSNILKLSKNDHPH